MDKPADPATPFREVYQAFYTDLAQEGTKSSTIARSRYNGSASDLPAELPRPRQRQGVDIGVDG